MRRKHSFEMQSTSQMTQSSKFTSRPVKNKIWNKDENKDRALCVAKADTISVDGLIHDCIIEKKTKKHRMNVENLKIAQTDTYHRSSSRFKLIVCLKKTTVDLPISCLKIITSSILTAVKDVDLLLIDLGEERHHQDWIDTVGQDLRYKRRPAIGIIEEQWEEDRQSGEKTDKVFNRRVGRYIKTGQNKAEYSRYKYFGHLIVTSSGQKLNIISREGGYYRCDIVISQSNDSEGSPVVKIEVPDENEGQKPRNSTDELSLSFDEAIRSIYIRKKIYQAVKEHSRLKEFPLDNLLLRISLSIPNENLFKKPTIESKEALLHVMLSAVMDYNHKVLAGLYEMNAIGLNFGDDLIKVIKEISKTNETVTRKKIKENLKEFWEINLDKEGDEEDDKEDDKEHDKEGILMMFLHSLLVDQFKASLFYWSQLDHLIANAVVAQYILTKMSLNEKEGKSHKKITKFIKVYQNVANDVLLSCTLESSKLTNELLVSKITYWDGKSCVTLAKKTENKIFLHQEACRALNRSIWRGQNLKEKQEIGPIHKMLTPTPKICFILDMIGYLIFLICYGFLLVIQLKQSKFHFLEAVVIVYVVTLFMREYDQCFCQGSRFKIFTWEYLLDLFNIVDILALFMSVVAWGLRLTAYLAGHRRWMYAARYFFSFNYLLYSIRFLEYFYLNRALGPILVTIVHLLKIYVPFMTVVLVFLLAYSVASESLVYPETPLNSGTLYYVFRKGFWAMIGEYNLEELETLTDCTYDSALYGNYTERRCPAKYSRYMGYILMGLFSLFVQILLFNILIGLFSDAITRNYSEADLIGNLQRFHLSMEYSTIKYLLPPFLPLCFFLSKTVKDPYATDVPSDGVGNSKDLIDFERLAAEKTITSILDQSILKGKTQKRLTARRKLMKAKYETRQKIRMSKIGPENFGSVKRETQGHSDLDKMLVLTEDDLHLVAFKMAQIMADANQEELDQ